MKRRAFLKSIGLLAVAPGVAVATKPRTADVYQLPYGLYMELCGDKLVLAKRRLTCHWTQRHEVAFSQNFRRFPYTEENVFAVRVDITPIDEYTRKWFEEEHGMPSGMNCMLTLWYVQ